MEFRYGISPESMSRWLAFERIVAVQEQRGADVGQGALKNFVDAELGAIERATREHELRQVASEPSAPPRLRSTSPLSDR